MNYVEYDTSFPVSSDQVNRYFYILYKLHKQIYNSMGGPEIALVLEDWVRSTHGEYQSTYITSCLQGPW